MSKSARRYFTRILRLSFLAPEILQAILRDRHPIELTAKRLAASIVHRQDCGVSGVARAQQCACCANVAHLRTNSARVPVQHPQRSCIAVVPTKIA